MKKNYLLISCILTSIIVFTFYFHTLGYSWKIFDENLIYQEIALPIPGSLEELNEIISLFGLNNYYDSGNPFYSNISNLRGSPVDTAFTLLIYLILKKSAFGYHAYLLFMHLLNTCLCFLILNKILNPIQDQKPGKNNLNFTNYLIAPLLVLIWSLHPVNVESILSATNFGTLTANFFYLLIFYYFLRVQINRSFLTQTGIFLCYLIPLYLREHIGTLALVLFTYLFAQKIHLNPKSGIKNAVRDTLKETAPLFLAFFVFVISFFFFSKNQTIPTSDFSMTVERICWLLPQIFFHFLKLVFFPKDLSIDQSSFVKLGNTYFEPYPVFCILLTGLIILTSFIALLFIRKKMFFNVFILTTTFFLSLSTFLHIISPIYNLASERYLYLPLFFLIFGLSHFISNVESASKKMIIVILLSLTLIASGTRSYFRTLDWRDGLSLLKSAVDNAPNNLHKGLREFLMTATMEILYPEKAKDTLPIHTLNGLSIISTAFEDFKKKAELYEKSIPKIIKFYGLDPKTLKAKSTFLTALVQMSLNYDPQKAISILSPYVNDIEIVDSLVADFYCQILFSVKNLDEAERFLKKAEMEKLKNSILYLKLSDLYEQKYNDMKSAEKYLIESFEYFPYDVATLYYLRKHYHKIKDAENFARFSHLYGLRTHDFSSLEASASMYISLRKKNEAKRVLKLLYKYYPGEEGTKNVKLAFEQNFGAN